MAVVGKVCGVVWISSLVMLGGCSTRAWYEGLALGEKAQCQALPPGAYEECRSRLYKVPYGTYEKERGGPSASSKTMTIDLDSLWKFSDPALSEERFRNALKTASGDNAFILHTQIARTYGLRKDFAKARDILSGIASERDMAGAQAQTYYWLEWGRTYASATHPADAITADTKAQARDAYERAIAIAAQAGLDGLRVDALHMLAFVDTSDQDQLKWGLQALEVVQASDQPAAKKWEASLRNNVGYALHQLGRFEEALDQFQKAVVLRERGTDPSAIRVAHWMVAWTLRALGRTEQALQIQLRLERECQAAGAPDPYVFEELETIYRSMGNAERAAHYAKLRQSSKP